MPATYATVAGDNTMQRRGCLEHQQVQNYNAQEVGQRPTHKTNNGIKCLGRRSETSSDPYVQGGATLKHLEQPQQTSRQNGDNRSEHRGRTDRCDKKYTKHVNKFL